MDSKIIIGIIILVILGIAFYFAVSSSDNLFVSSDIGTDDIPELPESNGLSADALSIFKNPQSVGTPPAIPGE